MWIEKQLSCVLYRRTLQSSDVCQLVWSVTELCSVQKDSAVFRCVSVGVECDSVVFCTQGLCSLQMCVSWCGV